MATTRFPSIHRRFWERQEGLVHVDNKAQVFAWGGFLVLPEPNTWDIFLHC